MGIDFFRSDPELSQKWMQIYDEHSFPFDVRYQLDEYLDSVAWNDLSSDDARVPAQVFKRLMHELDRKIEGMEIGLSKLHLQNAKAKIQEQFTARPAELLDVLQNCFNRERLLIESTKADEDRHATEEDVELLKYRQKGDEIKTIIYKLKQHNQQLEVAIDDFHQYMQQTVPKINDLQERVKCLSTTPNSDIQKVNTEIKSHNNEINTFAARITEKKTGLTDSLYKGSCVVSQVLEKCWELIKYYKHQQKLSVCYLAKTPEGAVDALNKACEESSRQLKAYIVHVDQILTDVGLLQFQSDRAKEYLERIKGELDLLLGKHLYQIFLITKQPQNIQKIVQNKSPSLSMCVRLLGGCGLGIEHSIPSVTLRVYAEQHLKEALETSLPQLEGGKTVCKTIENGTNIKMEVKHATGQIQANLNNVQLRGVERLEKKMKDDRVTEHKYGMVFSTAVNVCNKLYPLKTVSWPIVLTSQTSQNGAAKGTLVWYSAFSKEDGLYEDEPEVPWPKMEQVLRAMFKDTGRELDQEQLNYIARYIFSNGIEEDFTKCHLTKERFLREKVQGRDFTFWRWIYACKNLIETHVSREWKDRIIYGFIGRTEAERLLSHLPPGTFLLRFRERKLEESQRASKCACIAVAVVGRDPQSGEPKVDHVKDHLTPTDIHKYSLMRILNSLVEVQTKEPLLQTLYPDIDFQTLVKNYLPDQGEASDGYNRTRLLIGVHMKGRTEFDDCCSENPMTPDTIPPSPGTLAEFPSLSEDLQNIHVEPFPDTLANFLTSDGNMLMMGNQLNNRIDPVIPMTVIELEDNCSIQSRPDISA